MRIVDALEVLDTAIRLSKQAGSPPGHLELVTITRSQAIELRAVMLEASALALMTSLGQANRGSANKLIGDRPYVPNVAPPPRRSLRSGKPKK